MLAGLLLATLSPVVIVAVSLLAGWWVRGLGRRRLASAAVACTAGGLALAGVLLRLVDWPLRLVVLPAVVATALTQLAPDGRAAHRFAASWLRAQLAAPPTPRPHPRPGGWARRR